jgi:hypothetical protein
VLAAAAATGSMVFCVAQQAQAAQVRRRARMSDGLAYSLAAQLPGDWYVLSDLVLQPSWGVRIHIWAVVVAGGGVAVLHPCGEAGDLYPMGHVWMVGRGRTGRVIPSPAGVCWGAAEALKEFVPFAGIPISPLVVLTDLSSVYHPAGAGAPVVGAPHVAAALQRMLAGQILPPADLARLAADLCRYHP